MSLDLSKYNNFYGVKRTCEHICYMTGNDETVFVYGKTKEECYKYLDTYLEENKINKNVWVYDVGVKPHIPIPTAVNIFEVSIIDRPTVVLCSRLYKVKENI